MLRVSLEGLSLKLDPHEVRPSTSLDTHKFPKADALRIAMDEINSFLMRDDVDMNVKLVVFDDKAFRLLR